MCKGNCMNCVYYFEDTDFCLKTMYAAKNTGRICPDWKSKNDYSPDTFITSEDLEFSTEITDCRADYTTISELFEELKAFNEEILD